MRPPDDFPGEMDKFPFPFDEHDADAVFGASSGTQPVPEAFYDVAELVHAARGAGSADELAGEDAVVARIAAAVREHAVSPEGVAHERIRVLSKFRTAKVAAASTAVLLLGGTAAAAATGTLPSPVEHSVARGLSGVGINLSTHHQVELALKHAAPPAKVKALHHKHPRREPGAFGAVGSVNGVSDPGTCGVADTAGSFALTGPKGKAFTVNVSPTTPVVAKGVTGATFVNVCVGDLVAAKGAVAGGIVTATKIFVTPPPPPHVPSGATGIVASVNGVSDPGTCGVSGAAGSFTLTAHKSKTFAVSVDSSTKFRMLGVTQASFVNVCVGAKTGAEGDITGTAVTAARVFVFPTDMGNHDADHSHKGAGHFPKRASRNDKKHVGDDHEAPEHHATAGSGATGGSGGSGAKMESHHKARHGH